jgi:phage gpG-like protein
VDLAINVQGSEALLRVLNALVPALDVTEIADEAAAILLARNRARFLKQQAPDGTVWQVSKAALWRAAHGKGGGTLYDTGQMFRSMQLGDPAHGTPEEASAEIRVGVPYAGYHYFGIGQVVRIFLGFADDDREPIVNYVASRIAEAVGVGE